MVTLLLSLFGNNGEHWCQGAEARRVDGEPTGCLDQDAKAWCLMGGMAKLGIPLSEIQNFVGSFDVCWFNDHITWEDLKERLLSAETICCNGKEI